MTSKTCPVCARTFIQDHGNQIYCSKKCMVEQHYNAIESRKIRRIVQHEKHLICEAVHHSKADEDSLFHDPEFIRALTGVTCEVRAKEVVQ